MLFVDKEAAENGEDNESVTFSLTQSLSMATSMSSRLTHLSLICRVLAAKCY